MAKYLVFLFFLLGQVIMCPSYPQVDKTFRFFHIGLNEGLSQSTVVNITQDKVGNMWFATYNGLNKYNGYEFSVYKHNESDTCSIAGDVVRVCHRDRSGNMWAGTAQGLSLYDPYKDSFRNFAYSDGECNVKGIADFDEHELLLYVNEQLLLFDCDKGIFLKDALPEMLSSIIPTSLRQQGDKVYNGSRMGMFIYSISQKKFQSLFIDALKGKVVLTMLQESATRLWVGTGGDGLFLVNPHNNQVVHYLHTSDKRRSVDSGHIRALGFDSEQRLWIGTLNSLYVYDVNEDAFQFYGDDNVDEHSLSHASVRSIFMDLQGGMWIGTYFGGINYYHSLKNRFRNLQVSANKKQLNSNVIGCIREDASGDLWIGTNEGGVNRYEPSSGKFTYFTMKDGLGGNDVKALYVDEDEDLVYVGTHAGGLNVIHRKTGRIEKLKTKYGQNIYAIEPAGKDNFWLSGLSVLLHFNSRTKTFTRVSIDNPVLKSGIMFIFRDSKHRLWIGGRNGVDVFKDDDGKLSCCKLFVSGDQPFWRKHVNCVYEAHDGIFWIATHSGLYRFDESTRETKCYTTMQGLPDNTVDGILEDEYGKLWISTDKGLGSLQSKSGTFRNYMEVDGLQSNQFTEGAFCRAKDGEMYFGGVNGITVFHPARLVDNPYTPQVVITQLNLFNKPVHPGDATGILEKDISTTKRITLTAKQKMFSLQFVVSNYIAGTHNTFAYRLKGYDDEWYDTQMRTVSYSNLPQGTYRFMVKAANNDGKWNDPPTELEIVVLPVWYKTWWAILLFVMLVCAVLVAIFRYFWTRKMMQTQILLERKDKERQTEINEMKLRFFINIAHELRTPLTLILAPLSELLSQVDDRKMHKQLEYIQKSTNRLLHLVNQLMDYRRAELGVFALNVFRNKIYRNVQKTFLLYEHIAQEKGIRYHFNSEVEEEEILCDPEYVELILNNLLSNAFKYTNDGCITVTLRKEQGELLLSVKDTGRGIPLDKQKKIFERFYQVGNAGMSSGIGLSLVKKLVDMHHGRIELESADGQGSTFSVFLPADESAYAPDEIAKGGAAENKGKHSVSIQPLYMETDDEEILIEENDENALEAEKQKENVLIVEDNPEILRYLSDELGETYKVWEAKQGEEALEIVKEQEIDLILTDVMMPVMDGLQLCKRIKQNVRTCHIPVFILSAKVDLDEQLEGLQIGADDYIPKPFVMAMVKTKIRNNFRTRYRALQYYSKSLEVEPEKLSLNAMDEALLKKAKEVVEQHLDDAEFSTETFAREMCMSRSGLHLKMKALTGESSYDFIRKIRFNKAAKLLQEGGYTVAEISCMVGFSVPSYFSTSFKKYFGCLPTEYVQKKKNQQN